MFRFTVMAATAALLLIKHHFRHMMTIAMVNEKKQPAGCCHEKGNKCKKGHILNNFLHEGKNNLKSF